MYFFSKNNFTNLLLFISIGILLFGGGYRLGEYKTANSKIERPSYNVLNTKTDKKNVDFSLFWQTWDKLEQKYVDKKKIDPQKMVYSAIKGMVYALDDPYTFFLTPEENKQTKDDLGGKFEGIGAQLGLENNRIVIIAPLKNSPAEEAGVKRGDFIVKVNGESTKNWPLTQAVSKIRGPKNTKVKLALQRRELKEFDVEITRREINVPTLELSLETKKDCQQNCKKVQVIKLNQFGDNTNEEWDKAVNEVKKNWKDGTIKGLVVDFRDNPGGYLDSAIYLASEFLPEGKIVVKQESTVQESRSYYVTRVGKLLDIPVVALINKGSASASEIVTGALRDYKRAKLIGEKSFGKGSVQEALDLKTGAGLHVTVAKWILPKGDWINSKGINPDITVTNSVDTNNTLKRENDAQLDRAINEILK